MNYREEEFYNNGYTGIDLYYGDEYVCTVSLFDEKFIGNKKSKTYIDYLEINGFQFSLTIDLTNSSVIVVIEDENVGSYYQSGEFELDAFEIIPTSYIEEEEEVRVEIPLYVPALTYTNLMSSIVYDIDTPNILPLIDVDSVERFEKYLKDEIILFRHFLDLENVDQVINKEAIEEAKEKRKEERKLYGSGKQQTEIPEKKSVTLTEEEIVDLYSTIVNKELIIPVLTWNRQKTIHQDIFDLKKNNYDSIAIRVNSSFSGFLESSDTLITAIEDGFATSNLYIILDLSNNFAWSQYADIVKEISAKFTHTIYLGAQFGVGDISKKRDTETNMNHISTNKPLKIFSVLQKDCPGLGYGDYCGFDRRTITRAVGGRPTARVVLASTDKSMKMLVRRAWDGRDEKRDKNGNITIGLLHSMSLLMYQIQNGEIDQINGTPFLSDDYDVDISLKEYYPDRPSPGVLKTLCLRHNYLAIKNNFLKSD